MHIIASKDFEKIFGKYDRNIQERIINAVEKLPDGDIKKLHGIRTYPQLHRLRIGKYRILFRMDEQHIYLDKIDTRGDIYK